MCTPDVLKMTDQDLIFKKSALLPIFTAMEAYVGCRMQYDRCGDLDLMLTLVIARICLWFSLGTNGPPINKIPLI